MSGLVNFARSVFARPRTAWATLAVAVVLLVVYVVFDFREGGRSSSLTTVTLGTPQFYVEAFGLWFVVGALILNLALALASAVLMVGSFALYREKASRTGAVCSTGATLALGFAMFGCPGCIMPLFGTLGIAVFANAMPLFGLELKILSLILVLATLAWVSRRGAMGARAEADADARA